MEVSLVQKVFSDRLSETAFINNAILEAYRTLLSFCLDGGPYSVHPNVQVVGFFLRFPMTPILSQSDARPESYDKNTETCAKIFLEA
jgi:hypothetical protein